MNNFRNYIQSPNLLIGLYALGCGLSQSLMSFSGALFTLFAFAALKFVKTQRPLLNKIQKTGLLFLLFWVAFSLVNLSLQPHSDTTQKSFLRILLWLVPLVPMILPASKLKILKIHNQTFFILILLGLIPSIVLAGYQFFILKSHAFGFMKNTNYFAYNLLPALAFGLFNFKNSIDPKVKKLALWVALVSLLGLSFSLSRTALAVGYGLAFWTFISSQIKIPNKKWVFAGSVFFLMGLGGLSQSPLFKEKLDRTLSGNDPSFVWRTEAWKYNLKLFKDSPLWGTGYEQNGIDVDKIPELRGHWEGGRKIFAHNLFIQTLADSGILGFFLLYGFLVVCFFAYPSTRSLIAVTFLAGLTENTFTNSRSFHPFLLYFGLLIILNRQKQTQ